jgi:uncharacterized membrane protein
MAVFVPTSQWILFHDPYLHKGIARFLEGCMVADAHHLHTGSTLRTAKACRLLLFAWERSDA